LDGIAQRAKARTHAGADEFTRSRVEVKDMRGKRGMAKEGAGEAIYERSAAHGNVRRGGRVRGKERLRAGVGLRARGGGA
jgi:hypothetical protein